MTAILCYRDVGTQGSWRSNISTPVDMSNPPVAPDSKLAHDVCNGTWVQPEDYGTPPFLCIDDDVFAVIVSEVLKSKRRGFRSLLHLSLSCRRLRGLCLPMLFSRCAITNLRGNETGIPPLAIRPHVRHLTYSWALYRWRYNRPHEKQSGEEFGIALLYLPYVRSVTFTTAPGGVHWEALKICFGFPQVKSISFTPSAVFETVPAFPTDPISISSHLEELSYPTHLTPAITDMMWIRTTIGEVYALERACLSSLVLGMTATARSLVLPMVTAPLKDMAMADWPNLRDLTFGGSFPMDADYWVAGCLRSMLLRMPALRTLTITSALRRHTDIRCCLLGYDAPPASKLPSLQSLTLSYPDPHDAIFSIPLPDLDRLSLRDWPRHYDIMAHACYYRWRSPILSATEALSILQRLHAPNLTALELVYVADEADEHLLVLIANGFPRLRHLQLHRYRRSSTESVDFLHIGRTLSAMKALVTLRLNLDLPDDPGVHDGDLAVDDKALKRWRSRLSKIGWEILGVLEPCPLLEGVALLYHGEPPSMWVWHMRSRQATRRRVYDRSPEKRDSFTPEALGWPGSP